MSPGRGMYGSSRCRPVRRPTTSSCRYQGRDSFEPPRRRAAALDAGSPWRCGSVAMGKFFYLGGSTTLEPRGRCLVGDASGIMGRHIPFFVRRPPSAAARIGALADWEEKTARIVERYLSADVTALSACPSLGRSCCSTAPEAAAARGIKDAVISATSGRTCSTSCPTAWRSSRTARLYDALIGASDPLRRYLLAPPRRA